MAKILIVDDDLTIAEMYGERLAYEGHEIQIAPNGEKALEVVKIFKPALILMDIIMPRMNGLETADFLQKDPETSYIPVIFVSQLQQSYVGQEHPSVLIAPAYICKNEHTPQTVANFVNQFLHNQAKQQPTQKEVYASPYH